MDRKLNMRNHGYFTKWRNGGGDNWCSTVNGNGCCSGLTPSSSKEIARMAHADVRNITGDDQATRSVDQNYAYIVPVLWNLHLSDCEWCSTVDGGFRRSINRLRGHRGPSKFTSTRSRKAIWNSFSCCWMPTYSCYCPMFFFPISNHNGFRSHLLTFISWRSWPSAENRDIHIKVFFSRRFYFRQHNRYHKKYKYNQFSKESLYVRPEVRTAASRPM